MSPLYYLNPDDEPRVEGAEPELEVTWHPQTRDPDTFAPGWYWRATAGGTYWGVVACGVVAYPTEAAALEAARKAGARHGFAARMLRDREQAERERREAEDWDAAEARGDAEREAGR